MAKTLKEQYIKALLARGEKLVKQTHKFDVYTRTINGNGLPSNGYYYLGRSGSLRVGHTVVGSIPVSATFKQLLLSVAVS